MIVFPCPSCGRKLRAQESLIGKRPRCPACNSAVEVRASSAPVPPVEAVAHKPAARSWPTAPPLPAHLPPPVGRRRNRRSRGGVRVAFWSVVGSVGGWGVGLLAPTGLASLYGASSLGAHPSSLKFAIVGAIAGLMMGPAFMLMPRRLHDDPLEPPGA